MKRARMSIRGAVQGVGFRPYIFRLAEELGLCGWVNNSAQGVQLEIQGEDDSVERFLLRVEKEIPPRASIQSLEYSFLDPIHMKGFGIRGSLTGAKKSAIVLADIATCEDCLNEIRDKGDRRYRYPFNNCTHCGPRFSIVEALPYDRPNTSMKIFEMCELCRQEYENPQDRRFHAQPTGCSDCGPQLELWEPDGRKLADRNAALMRAADALRSGLIVAMKGLGGFQLLAHAENEEAIAKLRARKQRIEKPFAVMFPDLESVLDECEISPLEERLLRSPEAPIVLLRRWEAHVFGGRGRQGRSPRIPEIVAPNNPYLGVMLPYTPLHHLLMDDLGIPIVATSGNLSEEPICIDENEALIRLKGIADLFLVHNRPIVRHVDDSIVRMVLGREMVLRRARGYAPLPIHLSGFFPGATEDRPGPVLAVGAHLKNTVALALGENVFVSQHIGDLENEESYRAFYEVIESFEKLYETRPALVSADLHPDYMSTRFAIKSGSPHIQVQHHHAHVASCMAEYTETGDVLGVSWDGTGYGPDGTIWGGEFLVTSRTDFERLASFRTFMLPGASQAVKEPRRSALGILYGIYGSRFVEQEDLEPVRSFTKSDLSVMTRMMEGKLNSPLTSSAGRLFDAVAALLGIRQKTSFEGQAAMELEFAAAAAEGEVDAFSFAIRERPPEEASGEGPQAAAHAARFLVDWEPVFRDLIAGIRQGVDKGRLAARFHQTLVEIILEVAFIARRWADEGGQYGWNRVALTGGCFQNRVLTERAVRVLEDAGYRVYCHQRIPPNDGGISLGQAVVAARRAFDSEDTEES